MYFEGLIFKDWMVVLCLRLLGSSDWPLAGAILVTEARALIGRLIKQNRTQTRVRTTALTNKRSVARSSRLSQNLEDFV